MSRTEFLRGIKCKKCGSMDTPPFVHHCCQSCGAYIVEGYDKKDGWILTKDASVITIEEI
jgi:uncharacterized OB-fold protein